MTDKAKKYKYSSGIVAMKKKGTENHVLPLRNMLIEHGVVFPKGEEL